SPLPPPPTQHPAPPPPPSQPGGLPGAGTLLSGRVELARLVDLAAERLGVRVEYDPQRLAGQVTLRTPSPLSDRALWLLAQELLSARGLQLVRAAGLGAGEAPLYAVTPAAEAAGRAVVGLPR